MMANQMNSKRGRKSVYERIKDQPVTPAKKPSLSSKKLSSSPFLSVLKAKESETVGSELYETVSVMNKEAHLASLGLDLTKEENQVVKRLNSLEQIIRIQKNEIEKIKDDLIVIEEKVASKGRLEIENADQMRTDNESVLKMVEVVLSVDPLVEYNYIEWSREVMNQLEKIKLHSFLHRKPSLQRPDSISIDGKVKEAILNVVSLSAKSKINAINYTFAKELWIIIRQQFHEVYLDRQAFNLKYITRKDVRAISEIKPHVNSFRNSVVELIAIDLRFDHNILIELFINTFTKILPIFGAMIKQHSVAHDLNFTETLDFAASQACYTIRLKHSHEPVELDQQVFEVNSDASCENQD